VLLSVTLTDGLFPGTQSEDLISGVSAWLGAEENAGILEDTLIWCWAEGKVKMKLSDGSR